jgi:hypothetical protein
MARTKEDEQEIARLRLTQKPYVKVFFETSQERSQGLIAMLGGTFVVGYWLENEPIAERETEYTNPTLMLADILQWIRR